MNALLLTAWIGCQSLDLGTTAYALHSGQFHEANPIMRGPQLYSLKIGVNVAGFVLHKKIVAPHTDGWHKRLIPLAFAGAGCFAGGLNLHTMASVR